MLLNEEKFNIAVRLLISLKKCNWLLMESIFTKDVTWSFPGDSPLSGLAFGIEAVIKRIEQFKTYEILFQVNHILYGANGITLLVHTTSVRDGLILHEQIAIVCTIKDKKIKSLRTYISDLEGFDLFYICCV